MGSPRAPFLLNQTLDPHTSQDTQQSVDQDSEPKELDEEIKPIPLHITMETQSRDQKAFSRQKLPLLAKNFNPIPFSPSKTLDFSLHEDLFRALNLWDFVNLDLSSDIRSDLLILLLANYDPSKNRSFVHNIEVSVSRLDLAKALNLPLEKEDGETHQDAFSKDEQKGAILHFLSSYVLLEDEDEMSILAEEAVEAAKMVKEGKANEVDWVGLIWVLVEREILDAPRLGICRYASHLTCLMKRQQPILFEMEVGLGLDAVISVHEPTDDDDNDEEEDGGYLEEFGGPGLSLGADKNGGLMDAAEDSTNWVDQGKDEDGGFEHCLRRCSSKETRGMEFEDLCKGDEFSNLGRLTSTDLLHDMEEDRVPYSPTMNSPDQNNEVFLSAGLAGNKNASSSLFFENKGKRHIDNVDIDEDETDHFHQGTPLKRMRCGGLWQEQAPSGFDSYMEQIQCTMGKAKSIYAEKEQTYLDTHLQLQYLNDTIKQKDQVIRTLEKMQVEEKRTWQHNVHSYEQELNILANLVVGYKKALKETRNKFDEYRKKCPEGDEPLYIDVSGSGGLVLTSTELKRLQLEKEEAMCQIAEEMVDAFEHDWLVKLEEYADLVVMLHGRVVEIYRQVELIKERFAKRKGPNPRILHEKVEQRLSETIGSKLELIRPPRTKYVNLGVALVATMRSSVAAAIQGLLDQVPLPSFEEFVDTANSLTDSLHSMGLRDYTAWVAYLKKVGADLLYIEEVGKVDAPSEADQEAKALKSLESEVETEKSKISTLEFKREKHITTRTLYETHLHEIATTIEVTKKTLADLQRDYAEVSKTVEFIKKEEQTTDGDMTEHRARLAQVEREAKLLKDQLNNRDVALNYLVEECVRHLQHMREIQNPLA